jgi:PAS domain S-box-containing protein
MVEISGRELRELQDARDLAESTIDTVREPLIVLGADLRVQSASKAFYQAFKVKPEETEKKFIYDLGNKQWNIPALRQLLEEIVPKNESFDNYEVEHDFPFIGRRTMLLNARRIPRPPEKIRLILLAFEDVTERRGREIAKGKKSEEYLNNIINNIADPVFVKDENSVFLLANDALCEMLGIERQNIIGKTLGESLPRDQMDHFLDVDRRVLSSGQADESVEPLTAKDGIVLTLATKKTRYVDNEGRKYLIGVIRDITGSQQAEQEIRNSEARYRALFDSSSDILLQIDPVGVIVDINESAEILSGYKKAEIIGKKISALAGMFTIPSLAGIVANFAKRKMGIKVAPYEVEAIGAAGQRMIFEVSAVLMKDSAGKEIGELAILHDVTERKQAVDAVSAKVKELEKITKIMEGREDKIIELKNKVKELEGRLGGQ